jgi:hypothetical protein
MRRRLAIGIAGIVSLSGTLVLADFDDDRGIAAGVDQSPMIRVCGEVEAVRCRSNRFGSDSSMSTRKRHQCFFRKLEGSDRLRAADGWEIVEKLFQRIPGLKIVNEILGRHAGTGENDRPAERQGPMR